MAAVAFLHPQDAFHQNPALKPRRRLYDPAIPLTNSTAAAVNGGRRSPNSKRRKGSPTKKDAAPVNPKPRSTPKPTPTPTTTNLAPVMGQVKILKRGESLPEPSAPVPEKVVNQVAVAAVDALAQAPAKAAPLVSHKSLEKTTPAKTAPLVTHKSLEKTPVKFQKHLKFQYAFAGSATATSPEPNCVPLPSFCSKSSVIDDPSKQLCRLLGLAL